MILVLLLRLRSCRERLLALLDGRIEKIDELETEQIPFRPENDGHALRYNNFAGSYTACVP